MGTLRLMLALAVVIGHTQPYFGFVGIGASPAVTAFFIISGFYMQLVLSTRYSADTPAFYVNRLLRLFPAYWATLALMLAIAASGTAMFDAGYSRGALARAMDGSPLAWLAAFPNLLILGSDVERQIELDGLHLLVPQIWSVGNELIFYALAPFVARLKSPAFVAVIVAAVILQALSAQLPLEQRFLLPSFNAASFLLGMGAYRVSAGYERLPKMALVALASIPFAYFATNGALFAFTPAWYYLPFAVGVPALFALSQRNEVDRVIGDLSYPVYLVHFIFAGQRYGDWSAPIIGIQSIGIALVMVLIIERPMERLRHRWRAMAPKHRLVRHVSHSP